MQAGRLDQIITLNARQVARTASGSTVEQSANDPIQTCASVRQQGAAERERNGITTAENTYAIRIRYREGIDASWSITYRGRTLAITSVIEGGMNNREWLDINATEAK